MQYQVNCAVSGIYTLFIVSMRMSNYCKKQCTKQSHKQFSNNIKNRDTKGIYTYCISAFYALVYYKFYKPIFTTHILICGASIHATFRHCSYSHNATWTRHYAIRTLTMVFAIIHRITPAALISALFPAKKI